MGGTARSQSTDPFLLNRFHITDTEGFLNLTSPAGGFNTCTMPEVTLESHEYSEGLWCYRRKYPGQATFNDISMTKGVVKNDTSFWTWCLAGAENHSYRTNISIKHYHRDDVVGVLDFTNAVPSREIILNNALCLVTKLGSDFDALASDISVEELTIQYEYFRLKVNGAEVTVA